MTLDEERIQTLFRTLHRGVLVTRRRDGSLQTSPVVGAADDEGRFLISSREPAFKVRNLRRDPRATVCVFPDGFFGEWIQIDGTAEIIDLPDAMEALVETYRRIAGEHPDWEEFREAMRLERRVVIAVSPQSMGPRASG